MFERVYTVHDYYDGPRSGIANFGGRPHYYSCEWDDAANDYADSFTLVSIDEETLDLALEQWAIWKKWEVAFHNGHRHRGSHPALPGQNEWYAELDQRIKAKMAVLPVSHCARATFRACPRQESLPRGVIRDLEVQWSVLPNNALQATREDARA